MMFVLNLKLILILIISVIKLSFGFFGVDFAVDGGYRSAVSVRVKQQYQLKY